jgi:hypothetical protein
LDSTAAGLSALTTEIKNPMLEDTRILAGNPSLDLLFRLRIAAKERKDRKGIGIAAKRHKKRKKFKKIKGLRIARWSDVPLRVRVKFPPALVDSYRASSSQSLRSFAAIASAQTTV